MPELPEVETVCRTLRPHLLGRTIRRVEVLERRLRIPVDKRALAGLSGHRIEEITRRAKYILLYLSQGVVWVFHLGMSGKLVCVANGAERRRHDHIVVGFKGGGELR